jgi:hypothetical protein
MTIGIELMMKQDLLRMDFLMMLVDLMIYEVVLLIRCREECGGS